MCCIECLKGKKANYQKVEGTYPLPKRSPQLKQLSYLEQYYEPCGDAYFEVPRLTKT